MVTSQDDDFNKTGHSVGGGIWRGARGRPTSTILLENT